MNSTRVKRCASAWCKRSSRPASSSHVPSRSPTGPFRGGAGLHPGELAQMIVTDAISVVLAKGHVSEEEAQQIVTFATALGCSRDEVRRMSGHLAPWFASHFD